jgi:DNA-binding MarR family transcriptional regulator
MTLDLWGEATATPATTRGASTPHNGTETSRRAAQAARESGQATRQEGEILRALGAVDWRETERSRAYQQGLTRKELAQATGIVESTVCARVNALVARGLLREEGVRVPEGGSRGQKVVHLTAQGRTALAGEEKRG